MKGFPPELIYVLVFIGILLLQYLMKRRGREAPPDPAPGASVPPTLYETGEDSAMPGPPALMSTSMPGSIALPDRPEASAILRAPPRRRFSRQTLMGTRRDVQNAVVIAAILGPCRAFEPPDRTEDR